MKKDHEKKEGKTYVIASTGLEFDAEKKKTPVVNLAESLKHVDVDYFIFCDDNK